MCGILQPGSLMTVDIHAHLMGPEVPGKAIGEPSQVALERGISFSEEEVSAIMGDNAARLLKL